MEIFITITRFSKRKIISDSRRCGISRNYEDSEQKPIFMHNVSIYYEEFKINYFKRILKFHIGSMYISQFRFLYHIRMGLRFRK